MSALEIILRDAGVTYRQFDHWCTRGYVTGFGDDRNPGYGFPRNLTPHQIKHVRVMAGLVRGGVRPDVASGLAAQIMNGETAKVGDYVLTPAHRVEEAAS